MKPGFYVTCPFCGHPRRADDPVDLLYYPRATKEGRLGWYLPCGYCPELMPIPARKVEAAWTKTAIAASRRIVKLTARESDKDSGRPASQKTAE